MVRTNFYSEAWFNTHRTKGSPNLWFDEPWFELAARRLINTLLAG
jgi:hypothetical protein